MLEIVKVNPCAKSSNSNFADIISIFDLFQANVVLFFPLARLIYVIIKRITL